MRKLIFVVLCVFLKMTPVLGRGDIKGIQIDSRDRLIVVFIDGTQVCPPTNNCFVANLHPGNYRVEVYESSPRYGFNTPVYSQMLFYVGNKIERIELDDRKGSHNHGNSSQDAYPVMSDSDFDRFYDSLVSKTFDSEKRELIDLILATNYFTSSQVKRICKLYTFDSEKLPLMKRFYPRVVDKVNFYDVLDILDFPGSKSEMKDIMKNSITK